MNANIFSMMCKNRRVHCGTQYRDCVESLLMDLKELMYICNAPKLLLLSHKLYGYSV